MPQTSTLFILLLSFFKFSLAFASEAEVDTLFYFNEVEGIIVAEIIITDLSGRQVYQSQHNSESRIQVDLGTLESGVYLARIYGSERQKVHATKFLKVDSH